MQVGAMAMFRTFGKVYYSGPTDVSVNDFAERLCLVDRQVVAYINKDMSANDPNRARHSIIVRGYKLDHEIVAFRSLLERPHLGDAAAPSAHWHGESKWKLNQSLTYWFLLALGSRAVPKLEADDSKALHMLRSRIEGDQNLMKLRSCATGKLQWREIKTDLAISADTLGHLFGRLLTYADLVGTTPSLSEKKPYKEWKDANARAIAVDEASSLHRSDLMTVWGNTLLPCLLGGDDDIGLRSVVVKAKRDGLGKERFYPRHSEDGSLSAFSLFKVSGLPVCRL